MVNFTYFLFLGITAILGGLTSARLSVVMARHYSFKNCNRDAMGWATGILTAAIMIVSGVFAMKTYGLLGGLLLDVITIPAVGMVWMAITAANKVVERVVNGVDVTISKAD